jgi:hypothetical protein
LKPGESKSITERNYMKGSDYRKAKWHWKN